MSGPHDFAVRDRRIRLVRLSRPPHPCPTFVTIAKRPSGGQETRGNMPVICPTSQAKRSAANWHDGQITRVEMLVQAHASEFVMPGLVPGIHVFVWSREKAWMAGTSPAMTDSVRRAANHRSNINCKPSPTSFQTAPSDSGAPEGRYFGAVARWME
jgi:hypothetical protein